MIKFFCRIVLIQLVTSYALATALLAQTIPTVPLVNLDYTTPTDYVIKDIRVIGNKTVASKAIINLLGLRKGDTVLLPGGVTTSALSRLWKQGLVKDAAIYVTRATGHHVILTIDVTEYPRLSAYFFEGIKRKEQGKLLEKLSLAKGKIITNKLIQETERVIKAYFIEAGYKYATVTIVTIRDPIHAGHTQLKIEIDKGDKLVIDSIQFEGNKYVESDVLKRQMRHIREKPRFTLVKDIFKKTLSLQPIRKKGILWRPLHLEESWAYLQEHVIFTSSKFSQAKLEEDKKSIIRYYQSKGFRDAAIIEETISKQQGTSFQLQMKVEEGKKYRVGNISWTGNYLYDDNTLQQALNIKKGDVYNPLLLQQRLYNNPEGQDVASLYLNNGYLFFQAIPVETGLKENTIDLEIRITEGTEIRINKVLIEGNKLTHDHVIRRELRTLPGDKFSNAKLQRSCRELGQLNLFSPIIEGLPIPNLTDKTVDIRYKVQERFKFSINLSGGWGGEFIGQLGLFTNNFSLSNLWKSRIPVGGGQTLGLSAETNGKGYRNLSLQFADSWLGGKKPRLFQASLNKFSDGNSGSIGGDIGLGTRLTWPDDYMMFSSKLAYYHHNYEDYDLIGNDKKCTGTLNDLSATISLERDSTAPNPIYPKKGSKLALHANITPPWSLFYSNAHGDLDPPEKYNWKEYQQWMLNGSYFWRLLDDLVLNVRAYFGILGCFSSKSNISPFERFVLGGGTRPSHRTLRGEEHISLRGYEEAYITPEDEITHYKGGVIYDKFVLELRYPLISNYAATTYILAFVEGGNTWAQYDEYKLLDLKRSAGAGLRIYIPFVIGTTIGFDFGYGFDKKPMDKKYNEPEFHFSVGMDF